MAAALITGSSGLVGSERVAHFDGQPEVSVDDILVELAAADGS